MQLTHKEYCYYLLMCFRESTQGGLCIYIYVSIPYPILNSSHHHILSLFASL